MITKQTGGARPRGPDMERRHNPKQRARFDTAMMLLQPLLEQTAANDTMMYRVMERLQATYPDMSPGDVEALMMSALRTLKKRAGSPHLTVVSN